MSVRRLAPPDVQPKEFSFNKENLEWAKKQVTKYPEGRQQSAIIPLLWRAQEQHQIFGPGALGRALPGLNWIEHIARTCRPPLRLIAHLVSQGRVTRRTR